MSRSHPVERGNRSQGFSAIEALVSIVILAIVVLFSVTIFQSSNRAARKATIQGDSQQSARVAIDLLTRDLRGLGYGLEIGAGQPALVYASPWDVIFNANLEPGTDDPMAPGSPGAIDLSRAPAVVPVGGPIYVPPVTYASGAETIRYTLDSNGDGQVGLGDLGDDPEEASPNPRDFVLRKEVYGAIPDGTNGGVGEPVAIVRGPIADTNGTLPMPLFTFWIDHDDDPTTDEILHGDTDGDLQLSQAEIAALGPVPANQLALVTRTTVTVSSEDAEADGRAEFRTRQLVASVRFRNSILRTAVIAGVVFQDEDVDGVYDLSDESPIQGVTVRLSDGTTYTTDTLGRYMFEVTPGTYTVSELDLPGYVSTTPNTYTVTLTTGSSAVRDFGDRPGSGIGRIEAKVYDDANQNLVLDPDELPLEGVLVTLHTGQQDTTDALGEVGFDVPVGTYTVVETDPIGWGSTTPNAVEVTLASDGDVARVAYGDVTMASSGTIRGFVFLDTDQDGVRDLDEDGISDVKLMISSGDTTWTDGNGEYSFTAPTGLHWVYEWDSPGYTSTTPNYALDLLVVPDTTIVVDFGDILATNLSFTVVTVGQTDRALSIATGDFFEDTKGDPDIVLGTQITTGGSNLHVWHNERRNSNTAITALFAPTPSASRSTGYPIPALLLPDSNFDAVPDILAGLETTSDNDLSLWTTMTSGGSAGYPPAAATALERTVLGSSVLSLAEVWWPGWPLPALVVGLTDGTGAGHVEVWRQSSADTYGHYAIGDLLADSRGTLGEVMAVASGDFDGDYVPDLAIGQSTALGGRVTVLLGDPGVPFVWTERAILDTDGAVLALTAIDMAEDNGGDVDLLVGTSKAPGVGVVELWLNDGTGTFGDPGDSTSTRVPSDWVDPSGEVLTLTASRLDPDVFPDIVVGLRTAQYAGALSVFQGLGYLPSSGTEWSHSGSGEVVTCSVSDFNIDGLRDIAVGTRTAASTGELVVYFGQ
jgi:type II secretory pathway pseudopilin PulG